MVGCTEIFTIWWIFITSYKFSNMCKLWIKMFNTKCIYLLAVGIALLVNFPLETSSYTEIGSPFPSMDYKIFVESGREDCVYQYTPPDTIFYVDFQVIRGGDGKVGYTIKDPENRIVFSLQWEKNATYETTSAVGGYYAVCIDNKLSTLSGKLVSVYMANYEAAGWEQFMQEFDEFNLDSQTFATRFQSIAQRMTEALHYIHRSKANEARDLTVLIDTNYNVGFWSFVQCSIILLSGGFHVYAIRQLFQEKPSHANYKVRP